MVKNRKVLRSMAGIIFWLLLWQVLSIRIRNPVFFPSPVEVGKALGEMLVSAQTYRSCLHSLLRILCGFLSAFLLGYLLAWAAARLVWLRILLEPVVQVCKAVPVASLVVLLLIWFGASGLTFFVTFMVVFPNIYLNVAEGIRSAPSDLLEMAQVFRMPFVRRYYYIYRPAIRPFLEGALRFSVGMSFKSGVAAEVIGLTGDSIGEGLYLDKIYLNTAGVFAWTILIILLSVLSEKGILWLLRKWFIYVPWSVRNLPGKQKNELCPVSIRLEHLGQSYRDKVLLQNFSYTFHAGKRYGLLGKSGCGKTTLLRMLARLTNPQQGRIVYESGKQSGRPQEEYVPEEIKLSMQFQENRLCMDFSAYENVCMAGNYDKETRKKIEKTLSDTLGQQWVHCPVRLLSGGMQRRTAFLRAWFYPSRLLLLDEPFTGLDEGSKRQMQQLLEESTGERILFMATHDREELSRLHAEVVPLFGQREERI